MKLIWCAYPACEPIGRSLLARASRYPNDRALTLLALRACTALKLLLWAGHATVPEQELVPLYLDWGINNCVQSGKSGQRSPGSDSSDRMLM
jgi:hypothetical protein